MIDTFSLLLMHGLIFLTCWRLLCRDDLDEESGEKTDFLRRGSSVDRGNGAAKPDA
jgi:hypothetical protein